MIIHKCVEKRSNFVGQHYWTNTIILMILRIVILALLKFH